MSLVRITEEEQAGLSISGLVVTSSAKIIQNPKTQEDCVMSIDEIVHENVMYKILRFFDPKECKEVEIVGKNVTKYPSFPTFEFVRYQIQPSDKFEITPLH